MKTIIPLILFLILLISLSGCATKTQEPTTTPEPSKVSKEAAEERAAPPVQGNPKVLELLVNKDITPNIIYEFSRPPTDPKIFKYSVKGDKARIDLPRLSYLPKGTPRTDVVYLDLAANKAVAYCEERGVCPDRNMAYDVDFSTYNQKNPYDWLKDVPGDAEIVGTEQISTRDVTHIKYDSNGATTELWIDEFYKVPLEVQVKSALGVSRYIYKLVSIGSVKDSELDHHQLENY